MASGWGWGVSVESERKLLEWKNEENDVGDDLHEHFQLFDRWNWVDIAEEGRRIQNLMFDENVEIDSPYHCLLKAIAAQAYEGAYMAMAKALGIDSSDLSQAANHWFDMQDSTQSPIGFTGLQRLIEEAKRKRMRHERPSTSEDDNASA